MNKKEYIKRFGLYTSQMLETTKRKNADYTGDTEDPFKNFRMVEEMGVSSTEQGFVTRMVDKIMRISGFVKNGTLKVKDESVKDTLLDLATYCILMVCYLDSKKEENHE